MKAEKNNGGETVEVKGHQLTCPICANTYFYQRSAQLNTSAASFFGLDWANKSARCFVCTSCTYIFWFLGK